MAKTSKETPPEYRYFNHLTFAWNNDRWEATGPGIKVPFHWWVEILGRDCQFQNELSEDFGILTEWVTIRHAERQIEECRGYPVFRVDPDPLFLRGWLDTWVETNLARIAGHVLDVSRRNGLKDRDAEKLAKQKSAEYEALFLEPVV